MQDFLSDVNEQLIKKRIDNLKLMILSQKKLIINKIQKYLIQKNIHKTQIINNIQFNVDKYHNNQISLQDRQNYCLKNYYNNININKEQKNKKQLQQNFQYVKFTENIINQTQKQIQIFINACYEILNVYFRLLMDDDFLALQSYQEISQKLRELSNIVDKSISSFLKRINLNRQLEEVKQGKQATELFQDNKKNYQQKRQLSLNENHMQQSSESSDKLVKSTKKSLKKNKYSLKKKGMNSKIPAENTYIMQKWLLQNFQSPYPSQLKKQQMAKQSGLTVSQVNNWFINARERVIKKFMKNDVNNSNIYEGGKQCKYHESSVKKQNSQQQFSSKDQRIKKKLIKKVKNNDKN